jgi:hypothetical protein
MRTLQERPLSGNMTRETADEAITIAAGLPRAEVEQRAQRAFDSANDTRARLRGLPDTAKRAHAVTRARTWADILQHMDATGEPQFCGYPYDPTPPAVVRAVWIAWDWLARQALLLNVAALIQGLRDVLGAEPITFYQWPEPPPGIEPTPATREAGAGTPSAMPTDDDAPSFGGLQQAGCAFTVVPLDVLRDGVRGLIAAAASPGVAAPASSGPPTLPTLAPNRSTTRWAPPHWRQRSSAG